MVSALQSLQAGGASGIKKAVTPKDGTARWGMSAVRGAHRPLGKASRRLHLLTSHLKANRKKSIPNRGKSRCKGLEAS